MLKPCCFCGDGVPQNSLLIVLMRRLFSVFFFSSNLEKVSGVPSSLGLRDNKLQLELEQGQQRVRFSSINLAFFNFHIFELL